MAEVNEKNVLRSAVKILRTRSDNEEIVADMLERVIKNDSRLSPEGALRISVAARRRHEQSRQARLKRPLSLVPKAA